MNEYSRYQEAILYRNSRPMLSTQTEVIKQHFIFISCLLICFVSAQCSFLSPRESIAGKDFVFQIQPFKDTVISLDNQVLSYEILETDKNIAKIKLTIPKNSFSNELIFSAEGFQSKRIEILQPMDIQDELIVLDKKNSSHHFVRRIKTGLQPKSVRFIDKHRLAIPLLDDDGIDIIDILTKKTVRISPPAEYKQKFGFVETVSIPEYQELWVSQMHTNSVHVFDLKTLEYKTTVHLTGKFAKILLYDVTRDLVYCSNWLSEDISIIDRKSKKEIRKTPKIGLPRGLFLSKDGSELFIAQFAASNNDSAGGQLIVYSLETEKTSEVKSPSGNKRHIVGNSAGDKIYVSDMCCSKIEIYNPVTKTLLKTIPVFDKPNTIALSPDERYLYVSCRGPNHPKDGYLKKGNFLGQVFVIDTKTDEVIDSWEAGNQTTGLDVSSDNRFLVISDFLDNQIRVYTRN